jgi:hypothetical protein
MHTMRAKANVITEIGGAADDGARGIDVVVWLTTVLADASQSTVVWEMGSADAVCTRDGRTKVVDVFTSDDPAGFTATAKYEKPGVSAV